jgi:hypothetical protein
MVATFRARRKVYAVFFSIGVVFLLASIVIWENEQYGDFTGMISVAASYYLFIFFWISRFQLTLMDDSISYRSLFWGTRSLRFADIQTAEVLVGVYSYLDRFKPFFRLEIHPFPTTGKKPIIVNINVFGADAWVALDTFLGAKLR